MSANSFDLIIIGGGAAGLVCAKLAKGLGKTVAIIEKNRLGGECTWTGCVPSKTLIHVAHQVRDAQKMKSFTKNEAQFEIDPSKIMSYVQAKRNTIAQKADAQALNKLGIDVLFGEPVFIDPFTIEVDKKIVRAKKYIICTGSRPFIPPIDGLENVKYLTNQTIFEMKEFPQEMTILGGGPIGIEMACAFNAFGVKITILEMNKQILANEDAELSALLAQHMKSQGIEIKTNSKLAKVSYDENIKLLIEQSDGAKTQLSTQSLLIAVGRRPNIENLGLENIGVESTQKGIKVNNRLQTTKSHIYACGDVVGPYQFSHMAEYQAIIATRNAIIPFFKSRIDYTKKMWVTFSDPELAFSGLTEVQAREVHGDAIQIFRAPYDSIDRTIIDENAVGLCKIICDKKGYIIGAHILGTRAGELIHEIQIGKVYNLKFRNFYHVIHAYPTYSELIWHAARKAYIEYVSNNFFVKIFSWLFGAKNKK